MSTTATERKNIVTFKGTPVTITGNEIKVGDQAPDFTLPSVHEGDISLSQYRGEKHVILSFHVFDFTAG